MSSHSPISRSSWIKKSSIETYIGHFLFLRRSWVIHSMENIAKPRTFLSSHVYASGHCECAGYNNTYIYSIVCALISWFIERLLQWQSKLLDAGGVKFLHILPKFNAFDDALLSLRIEIILRWAQLWLWDLPLFTQWNPLALAKSRTVDEKNNTSGCGLREQNLLFDGDGNLLGEQREPPAVLGHLLAYHIPWATHQFHFDNCAKFNLIRSLLRREAIKMQTLVCCFAGLHNEFPISLTLC